MPAARLRILAAIVLVGITAACSPSDAPTMSSSEQGSVQDPPAELVQEPAAAPTVAADAGAAAGPSTSTSVPAAAAPAAAAAPGWVLGATPLPKGADGKPLVLPTPPALRDRRLPTVDHLPPPPADAPYRSTAAPIDAAVAARMGSTWQPGCPVPLSGLRYLTMSFWGFDGRPHTGEMVVSSRVADDVRKVFGRLFAARFPLEEMRIIVPADVDAEPTGDGNNTAAFICRAVRGSTSTPSAHSSGVAVDINPFHNPYKKGASVLPELAGAYLDRSSDRPGMIKRGDVVTKAFAEVGWGWGGAWSSSKDYMHFSANGR